MLRVPSIISFEGKHLFHFRQKYLNLGIKDEVLHHVIHRFVQGSIEAVSYPTKFRQNLFHLHHGSLLRLKLKVNQGNNNWGRIEPCSCRVSNIN